MRVHRTFLVSSWYIELYLCKNWKRINCVSKKSCVSTEKSSMRKLSRNFPLDHRNLRRKPISARISRRLFHVARFSEGFQYLHYYRYFSTGFNGDRSRPQIARFVCERLHFCNKTVKGSFYGPVRVSKLISDIKIDVNKLKMKCAAVNVFGKWVFRSGNSGYSCGRGAYWLSLSALASRRMKIRIVFLCMKSVWFIYASEVYFIFSPWKIRNKISRGLKILV